jgi:hypothetical protein
MLQILPALRTAAPASYLIVVVVEAGWALILIWIVSVGTLVIDVMLIVHLLGTCFGVLLCLMTIPSIFAFCLGQLVDLATDETSEEFFGEGV